MNRWSRVLGASLTRRRALGVGLLAGPAVLGAYFWRAYAGSARQPVAPTADGLRFDVPDASIPVRYRSIYPVATDAAIDIALLPHYVALSPVPARGRLFLFLPGTGAVAGRSLLLDQAARNGFHAVDLNYPNTDGIQDVCGPDPDTTCFENTRLEILDGMDRSTKVQVTRPNSVENRLLKLLAYLDATYPTEGWGAYIDGGAPHWSSIVVAGISQGGGHAAMLARDHMLARVAMFSAPVDKVRASQSPDSPWRPAPWLLGRHVTPAERYFAFGHMHDETTNWAVQWPQTNLGLTDFGPVVNVDNTDPPYGSSHMLLTGAPPRPNPSVPSNLRNHASITADEFTPLTDTGQPVFAPVWQHVCFA